jgi:NitT/TauT family transport system ATP-binding protein
MTDRIAAAFVPLVDCAVLVAARERGFAAAEGLELDLVKEPSWASLRDHLNLGYVDCAHALAPLPIASTLGVGHVQVDCVVPFVFGRGGNAITVSTQLFSEMQVAAHGAALDSPSAAGKALAAAVAKRAAPPTLGMVFPFSSHNFDLRYWLASSGVHPDRDVRLVAIPPPLMVESLRAGHVDGFCVGEPWNSLAVADGLGRIVATKSQLMPHGVEKVLAVCAPLEADAERLGKLLRALTSAAAWADDAANHAELAGLLARTSYLDTPAALLEAVLRGKLALGGGRVADDPSFIYFHKHAANVPRAEDALWIYAQMVRWGQLQPSAAAQLAAANVFRPDLLRRHVGLQAGTPPSSTPFDGIPFDARDIKGYLERFEVHTKFIERPAAEV